MQTIFYTLICTVALTVNAFATEVYSYRGKEQCFSTSDNGYKFHVVSPAPYPVVETDAKLIVKYKGKNPFRPARYTLELETAPNLWKHIGATSEVEAKLNMDIFKIPAETITKAIKDNQFLRFRNNNVYNGETGNCVQVEFSYNDPSAFKCPASQVDFGGKCRPAKGTFNETILKAGLCRLFNWREFSFSHTPLAKKDGQLNLSYTLCDGGDLDIELWTSRGWITMDHANTTLSCGLVDAQMIVPQVYLVLAGLGDNQIKFRAKAADRCASGAGCAGLDTPCISNAILKFDY